MLACWILDCSTEIEARIIELLNRLGKFMIPALILVWMVNLILPGGALAITDESDVTAIQDLYRTLNHPEQLSGWKSNGGDPCGEFWTGVMCFESHVTHINLHGLNLTGYLGGQLPNLHNLKHLDVSSNDIRGEIPYGLPPNATHINLACNNLTENIPAALSLLINLQHLDVSSNDIRGEIPYGLPPNATHINLACNNLTENIPAALSLLINLQHLNLSHNSLFGPVGNVFTGLQNLKEMDLSSNSLTGDLPSSFGSLTSLTGLFLQENKFTGSVIFLANIPLVDLNIQDNDFSGVIPEQFQRIPHLWMGGNKFHVGENYVPWDYPVAPVTNRTNTTSPVVTEASAIETHASHNVGPKKRSKLGSPGGIVVLVVGGVLFVGCAALIVAIHVRKYRAERLESLDNSESSLHSLRMSMSTDSHSFPRQESPRVFSLDLPPPIITQRSVLPARHIKTEKMSRRSFSDKCEIPGSVKLFTIAELQLATNGFSEVNLLGEGSLGCVYKAEFPDGQIVAVKIINTVALSIQEEEQFLDVIWNASRLKHSNIVALLGYCAEHGRHILVHEYVSHLSLEDALHCQAHTLISWSHRLWISLSIARALEYMHSTFFPPVAHCNLKAANILLDKELMPCVCDCGIATLRSLASNSVKLKASEMALGDTGYIAPEHGEPGTDNTKSDVYAFGVLLLELLTGRRPFDSSKPRQEQSLVKWASVRLHDSDSLQKMVDPGIRRTISSKSLSRFADIVSRCIQPEREYRPSMIEVVESLTCVIQKPSKVKTTSTNRADAEVDPLDRSFRSTHTRFMGSPATSFYSA